MSKRLKVVIDKPACCGYGVCAEICPEVYKLDENGIVYLDDEIVPEGLESSASFQLQFISTSRRSFTTIFSSG